MMNLKIDKPIRLIELFAGIGSQAKALERLGANFEHYRVCEFDKYAIKSYNAIHGTDFEISDITKITAEDLGIVDTDKFCYILTYSFPCQDLSLAGKQKLMAKGSGTRSSLLWEVERLLNECTELPQILLMENVTQVHGKKNKEHFDAWIAFLESKGYSNYWQDLNAKNFGIPQNRNRTFMVSVLGDFTYEFPKEFPLWLRLKDMLETEVDEKFYLSNEQMGKIVNWKAQQKPFERVLGRESIVQTITARGAGENHSGMIVFSSENENTTNMQSQVQEMAKNNLPVVNGDICKTIRAGGKGSIDRHSWDLVTDPFICASRGRNPENPSDRTAGIPTEQRLEPNYSGCSNTLTTVQKDNYVVEPFINVVGNYSPSGHDASRIVDGNGLAPTVKENHGTVTAVVEPLAYDEQNGYIRKDGTVGTLTCDGSSPKHNNRVVEPLVWDGYNQRIRKELGTVGSLTTNCGADLKRNGQGIIEPIVCEQRADEGLRFFKGDYCGTLRTIDACGDKRVIEASVSAPPEIIREEPLEKEGWHRHAKEVLSTQGVCRTLAAQSNNLVTKIKEPYSFRIRKLTPKECWRLMGFDDADFEKAAAENSNTQLYKQAGNSIVVDVLYYIFRNMLGGEK